MALHPEQGSHYHTGRALADLVGYKAEWLRGIPESAIESFAGMGNPFSIGELLPGENVVDVGCGAGMDSLIAAGMVAPDGRVIGIDMTPDMLVKARRAAEQTGLANVEFQQGYGEELPVPEGWADVIISNGVLNLMPDKAAALKEMAHCPQARWSPADWRDPGIKAAARECQAPDRPVDRLNCRCSAGSRVRGRSAGSGVR